MVLVVRSPPTAGDVRDQGLSLSQEDPLEKVWHPTPIFLPENPMDRGAWQAAISWTEEPGRLHRVR